MVPPFLLTFLKAFPLDLHFPCMKEKAPDVESHQNRDNLQKTVKHWFWRNYQFMKDAEPDRNQYLCFCSSKSLDPCVLITKSVIPQRVQILGFPLEMRGICTSQSATCLLLWGWRKTSLVFTGRWHPGSKLICTNFEEVRDVLTFATTKCFPPDCLH